jgi:hypothetical protein
MSATIQMDGQTGFTDLPALVGGGLRPASGRSAGWFPFKSVFAVGMDEPRNRLVGYPASASGRVECGRIGLGAKTKLGPKNWGRS